MIRAMTPEEVSRNHVAPDECRVVEPDRVFGEVACRRERPCGLHEGAL